MFWVCLGSLDQGSFLVPSVMDKSQNQMVSFLPGIASVIVGHVMLNTTWLALDLMATQVTSIPEMQQQIRLSRPCVQLYSGLGNGQDLLQVIGMPLCHLAWE